MTYHYVLPQRGLGWGNVQRTDEPGDQNGLTLFRWPRHQIAGPNKCSTGTMPEWNESVGSKRLDDGRVTKTFPDRGRTDVKGTWCRTTTNSPDKTAEVRRMSKTRSYGAEHRFLVIYLLGQFHFPNIDLSVKGIISSEQVYRDAGNRPVHSSTALWIARFDDFLSNLLLGNDRIWDFWQEQKKKKTTPFFGKVASSGGLGPARLRAGRQPMDWTFIRWLSWTLIHLL